MRADHIDGDVFVSTPISSFGLDEFEKFKIFCQSLQRRLAVRFPEKRIYCAALSVASQGSFDDPGESVLRDFSEIEKCSLFILLYPVKIASSSLIELGYAVAKKKKILMIAPDRTILPFMAQGLDIAREGVKISEMNPISGEAMDLIVKVVGGK